MNRKALSKKNAPTDAVRGSEFSACKIILKTRWIRILIEGYPKLIYSMMLLAMAASIIHFARSNPIASHQPPVLLPEKANIYVPSGFGRLLVTGSSIKEIWNIQTQLEGLLLKDSLSQDDSLLLRRVQQRFQITDHLHKDKP
jgi:hypothetical protein